MYGLGVGTKDPINTILPGHVQTEETQQRFKLSDPAITQARLAEIPMGRIGTPVDVADAAMLMLSEEAKFMIGQKLAIDGGL